MKALVGAFNQEKALVGAFSVIVQPVVEPMEQFAALKYFALYHVYVGNFLMMLVSAEIVDTGCE